MTAVVKGRWGGCPHARGTGGIRVVAGEADPDVSPETRWRAGVALSVPRKFMAGQEAVRIGR